MDKESGKAGPKISGRFADIDVIKQEPEMPQIALADNIELAKYIVEHARMGLDSTAKTIKLISEITKTVKKFCDGCGVSEQERGDVKFGVIRFLKKVLSAETESMNGGHKIIFTFDVHELRKISSAEKKIAEIILQKIL